MFVPQAYILSGAHPCYESPRTGDANKLATCSAADWALVAVTRPPEAAGHKFYMDYKPFSKSEMTSLKNRGYPSCEYDDPKSPPPFGCRDRILYGSSIYCAAGPFFGNEGGYATRVQHDCDTNPGHSGSALYQYVKQRPTIAGVHISACGSDVATCTAYATSGPGKNWMRAVTPTMVNQINTFVSAYP